MSRHNFGYVQQSMRNRSRSDPDLKVSLVLWRLDISLCEVSLQ